MCDVHFTVLSWSESPRLQGNHERHWRWRKIRPEAETIPAIQSEWYANLVPYCPTKEYQAIIWQTSKNANHWPMSRMSNLVLLEQNNSPNRRRSARKLPRPSLAPKTSTTTRRLSLKKVKRLGFFQSDIL